MFWSIDEKRVFKLFPLVVHYVSAVMRSAFADISVPLAGTPVLYVRAQHDPGKKRFFFFILTQKVLIRFLLINLYLTCNLLLKRG